MTFDLERNAVIVEQVKVLKLTDVHIIIILLSGSLLLRLTVIVIILLITAAIAVAALITVTTVIVVTVIILSIAVLLLGFAGEGNFVNKHLSHIMLSTVFVIIGTCPEISNNCNHSALAEITVDEFSLISPSHTGYKVSLSFFTLSNKTAIYRNCKRKYRNPLGSLS